MFGLKSNPKPTVFFLFAVFQDEFGCAVEPLIVPSMRIVWELVIQLWDNPEEITVKILGTIRAWAWQDKKIGVLLVFTFVKTVDVCAVFQSQTLLACWHQIGLTRGANKVSAGAAGYVFSFPFFLNQESEWESWSVQETRLEEDSAKCACVLHLTSGKWCCFTYKWKRMTGFLSSRIIQFG